MTRDEGLFDQIVMTSDGTMESVHPTQIKALVAEGTVYFAGGRWRSELTAVELAARVAVDMGVCDFCSRPNPAWVFPCRDFKQPALPGIDVGQMSIGAWGACEPCAKFIMLGAWDALAKRAMLALVANQPELASFRDLLTPHLRMLHRRFDQHRTGPPEKAAGQGTDTA